MRRILEVDLPNQRVVVEPGVTNIAVSEAVGPGHFYPPDPSSQIVCSIGGNVAENSGGAHCFKYGFTTNYVTGLEVVLTDGQVVHARRQGRSTSPGYDLVGRVRGLGGHARRGHQDHRCGWCPRPEAVRTLVAFFDSTSEAGEVVSAMVSEGIVPGAIEMMDNLSIRAAEGATNAGYPQDAGAALVVELDGSEHECEARFDAVVSMCEDGGSWQVRVAQDEDERALIWKTRKAAFAAMGRIAPNYYVQDSVIPRTRMAAVLRRIEELGAEYELQVANVFHAGDGNLHPLVCYDGSVEGEPERAEELAGMIVKACVDEGGSITGEHGVGVDKKRYMPSHVRRGRPGHVPAPALRLRPRRAGQPGQGHAHAAAVRRGARPVPQAPARGSRDRGADVSGSRQSASAVSWLPVTSGVADRLARGRRGGRPCASSAARTKCDWGALAMRPTSEISTLGLDRDPRAQRRRPDRGARRRRRAGRRAGGVRRRGPDAGAGPARRGAPPSAACRHRGLGPAAPPLRLGARPGGGHDRRAVRRHRGQVAAAR